MFSAFRRSEMCCRNLLPNRKSLIIALVVFGIIIQFRYSFFTKLSMQFISKVVQNVEKSQKIDCFNVTETEEPQSENDIEFGFDYQHNLPFSLNKERPAPLPYISGDLFRGMTHHIIEDEGGELNVAELGNDTTAVQLIYVRGNSIHVFARLQASIRTKFILLSHNWDSSVPPVNYEYLLNDENLVAWFGENIILVHPKLFPLPIGAAVTISDHNNGENGNIAVIRNASRSLVPFKARKRLLYINFSPETKKERVETLAYFKKNFEGKPNIEFVGQPNVPFDSYLRQLGDTKFVLSPPGNGIDCHRTWEALIMGAVPIVMNTSIASLYIDMPVMVVNSWSEVTIESLQMFEEKLNLSPCSVPKRPKIWARYWLQKIYSFMHQEAR